METMSKISPTKALELQHEQFAFSQSRKGFEFWSSFARDSQASEYQRAEKITLQTAPTYVIADEMLQVAAHAAKSMPIVPLTLTDLPSPSGFCLFEKPMLVPDVRGKNVSMAGFSWHCAVIPNKAQGVLWVTYSDIQDKDDHYYDASLNNDPTIPRLLPLGHNFEEFGKPTQVSDFNKVQGISKDRMLAALVHSRKLPLCIFALMKQTLVKTVPERPDRAARRRLKKAKSPLATKTVKVVKLRRIVHREASDGDGQPVDWSHRWVVNGHWRQQPTNDGPKRIWIMPFVKGPEDKPLVLKETVHVLER